MSDYAATARKAVADLVRTRGIGHSLRNHDPEGEPTGIIAHPGDLQVHASTSILAKDMAAMLNKRWPGFKWAIQTSDFGGVFRLYCFDFSATWCYLIKYADIRDDPQRKIVLKAAREILWRFGWPENMRWNAAQVAALPRDLRGEVPPITDGLRKDRHTLGADLERKLATGEARVVGLKDGGRIVETSK